MGAMLNQQELDRVCVVLVRARNPNNIGAAARAMHDFGFAGLRVVNQFPVPFEAARSAVDASAVLANAMVCSSIADAVGDCTLVIGTTAVGERDLRHPLLPLPEAAAHVRAELRRGNGAGSGNSIGSGAGAGRVALLFGSEKTGLSNQELSHCNWLLTVPMREQEALRHPSMNLGQAVAVCLYELVRDEPVRAAPDAGGGQVSRDEPNPLVETCAVATAPETAAGLERLTVLLSEVLEQTGYTRRHPANSDLAQVRRLVRRMSVHAGDAPVWMGILRQVLWKLGGIASRER